ncbi:SusC/RagA family TonB-linked outer membrane protein [Carboxylicivirga taeanensis]|uniref:SusC/RagA family TonB-linked outer membrane protein n=1 Tax=Carboxylicivirga taeanensis TaxID=1416875 RepID=UPI003F6DB19E
MKRNLSAKRRLSKLRRLGSAVLTFILILLTSANSFAKEDGEEFGSFKLAKSDIQQQSSVKGVVVDAKGEPIPGVNIFDKQNPSNGVISGIDGSYSIELSNSNSVLVFSFIGFEEQEISVAGRKVINVTMAEQSIGLDEVVAIGYGSKKKVNLTGSVDAVTADVIESRPVSNTLDAIQGTMPGVVVTRGSGQPGGGGYNIKIRGSASVNDNNPLVLVDGIPGSLSTVNPNDIESFTVLKDASAAIYGARAAGGVVLITTKSGKKGKPTIRISSYGAIKKPLNIVEYPDMYEFALMDNEGKRNNGQPIFWTADRLEKIKNGAAPEIYPGDQSGNLYLFYGTTDWMNEVLGNGFQQNHNVNISGGGEYTNYLFSLGYLSEDGLIKNAPDKNERYNMRMNYSYRLFDRLTVDTRVAYEKELTKEVINLNRVLAGAHDTPINFPVKTPKGNWFSQWGYANPAMIAKEGSPKVYDLNRLRTNIKLDLDIAEGLKLIGQSGIDFTIYDTKTEVRNLPQYFYSDVLSGYDWNTNPNWAENTFFKSTYKNFSTMLEYKKLFSDKHDLGLMAGASHEEYDRERFGAKRDNFISNELFALNLGDTKNQTNWGDGYHWAIESLFSRFNYSFNSKYLFEAAFRYDGSSRFSPEERWGLFPSVSAAWRLSEENFIKNLGVFDNLKLRSSWGQTGNQEGVDLYDYVQLIAISGIYPFGNGEKAQKAYLDGMVSKSRTWETVENLNFGLDATFLNSRMDMSFDYFIRTNKDMLIGVSLPKVLGDNPPFTNNGELEVKGWELSLGWNDKVKDFEYSAAFVVSDYKTEVVKLGGVDAAKEGWVKARQGYAMNSYFGYVFDGIIQTESELAEYKKLEGVPGYIGVGDAKYKDLNNDGKISLVDEEGKDADIKYLGTTDPRFNFGLNLNAKYKGFDLGVMLQGVGKRTSFFEGNAQIPFINFWNRPHKMYYETTWTPERTDAKYPRISQGDIRWWNYRRSTNTSVNTAYMRLKNLQIGYTLPKSIFTGTPIEKARIYFSGQDLWEIHSMPGGLDPEDNSYGTNYPFSRVFAFGVDITL